jgi:hypothetical protein
MPGVPRVVLLLAGIALGAGLVLLAGHGPVAGPGATRATAAPGATRREVAPSHLVGRAPVAPPREEAAAATSPIVVDRAAFEQHPLHGIVLDGESGAPVPEALVLLQPRDVPVTLGRALLLEG